jgi:secondary thiamine-phosphate synthase enzyme
MSKVARISAPRATKSRREPIESMRLYQDKLEVSTHGAGAIDLTAPVRDIVRKSGITTGLCTVFVQHTSAGLVIQENADPAVLRDLGRWLSSLAPESRDWEHDAEGPDDMPAHIRSVLTATSLSLPVSRGRCDLGTWQGVYLWEHRTSPHRRKITVSVVGA